ncbi:uncharacterized protein METZ01_LOCUS16992 [marine metagenome]|uniref:Thioesterase domain-containing protein n=1 Tax=marine metagenome TaxID=408172 RepID=A0A381PCW6_9ZZZZ|tara:strand:+ start:1348 stop:1845 length:498 start_codon:yes stop_codon:yes gene_type:complete
MRTIPDVTKRSADHYAQSTARPYPPERSGVDHCFGCSPSNDKGLRLEFFRHDDGTIETRHQTAGHHCGFDNVIHGGIQAVILDEVMGVAAQSSLPTKAPDLACATAEMRLTYLRPAFTADEVIGRAWVVAVAGRDIHVKAVLLSSDMVELTTAESRWRQMGTEPS